MNTWKRTRIGDLGKVITGKTPPTGEAKYFNGEYMFVSPKDLDWDQWRIHETETTVTALALDKFKNQVIPENSVLFTSLSFGFGKMGIAKEKCLTNQQINTVVVSPHHDF
jgi:type I restriction enzyme S subunit